MFKIPYLPALAWLVIVTGLSLMPGVPMPKFNLFSTDKIGHAAAYALLTWLLLQGCKVRNKRGVTTREIVLFFSLATGYGILMEFIQGAFFPYRFFEVDDMLANTFGAMIAAFLFWKRQGQAG